MKWLSRKQTPIETVAEFMPRYVFFENHEKFKNNFTLKWQHSALSAISDLLKMADDIDSGYEFSQNQWLEIYIFCYSCMTYFFQSVYFIKSLTPERKQNFMTILAENFLELLKERRLLGVSDKRTILAKSEAYRKALENEILKTGSGMYSEYGIMLAENTFGTERKTYQEKREAIKIATNAPHYFQIVTRVTRLTYETLVKEYRFT